MNLMEANSDILNFAQACKIMIYYFQHFELQNCILSANLKFNLNSGI